MFELSYKMKELFKNKVIIIAIVMIISVVGISYAFFSYNRDSEEESQLITGEVYMHYNDGENTISLTNAFPESDEDARSKTNNIATFTIDGKNTTTNKDIYYEIKLVYGDTIDGKTRLKDKDLKFDLVETVNNVSTTVLSGVSFDEINNTRIWVNTIPKTTASEMKRTYQLRMWISDDVIISDTEPNANYNTNVYKNSYASVKVEVYGDFEKKVLALPLYSKLETTLENSLLTSNGESRILAGSAVASNYVSYSDYLWRVVSVNDDGTIKIVTEDFVSEKRIVWDTDVPFQDSGVYEYLNNDFLNTLDNYEKVLVTDYKWLESEDNSTTKEQIVKPSSGNIVSAPVGMLTLYEFISSDASNLTKVNNKHYDNKKGMIVPLASDTAGCGGPMLDYLIDLNSYLGNDKSYFLLTTKETGYDRWSMSTTSATVGCPSNSYNYVRPSIVLNADAKYISTGDGSETNPYVLVIE